MREAAKVIHQIGMTSGYNDKLEILRRSAAVPGLKEILKFIYNPYCKTGISNAKLTKVLDTLITGHVETVRVVEWHDAIAYFSTHQTGSDADLAFARIFLKNAIAADDARVLNLAKAIITQDLKIGITATSLNNVYGKDFIPKVGCMLGTPFDDVPAHKIQWPCIVTEKLDGVRRVLVKKDGVARLYSRSGHLDEGLVEIVEDAKHLPDNFVYDGELLAKGTFKDSIALRQATNSLANSKGRKTGLCFNVFDMVPVDEFFAGASKENALTRKIRLGATFMDESIQILDEHWVVRIAAFGIHQELENIKPVPILGLVNSLLEVEDIVAPIWQDGGEGVMLNSTLAPYEIKRVKSLLKIKHTEEHVLPVVDIVEGTGKYEDMAGALVCIYTSKSGAQSYLGVGSGLTDDQRLDIWTNPTKYIGRKVEIECFGESINAQGFASLNCPIFKRFVGDVE